MSTTKADVYSFSSAWRKTESQTYVQVLQNNSDDNNKVFGASTVLRLRSNRSFPPPCSCCQTARSTWWRWWTRWATPSTPCRRRTWAWRRGSRPTCRGRRWEGLASRAAPTVRHASFYLFFLLLFSPCLIFKLGSSLCIQFIIYWPFYLRNKSFHILHDFRSLFFSFRFNGIA